MNEREENKEKPIASSGRGGDGGQVILIGEEIHGSGTISADGGDGEIGGNAGNVLISSKKNNFTGQVSARGGKASGKKEKDTIEEQDDLFKPEQPTWIGNTIWYWKFSKRFRWLTIILLALILISVGWYFANLKDRPGFSYTTFGQSWGAASTTIPTTL